MTESVIRLMIIRITNPERDRILIADVNKVCPSKESTKHLLVIPSVSILKPLMFKSKFFLTFYVLPSVPQISPDPTTTSYNPNTS